ncbi:MAG: hypothetical protein PUP93_04650 [Rhizonema sp. NSF051]|nr:hypothetical protein [Rhizonema sp. NSF051]
MYLPTNACQIFFCFFLYRCTLEEVTIKTRVQLQRMDTEEVAQVFFSGRSSAIVMILSPLCHSFT